MSGRPLHRALLLGGAGFLGSWVRHELETRAVQTIALGYGANGSGDLSTAITRESVAELVAKHEFDAVFFLAGSASVPRSLREPAQDLRDNAGVVVDVLEGIRMAGASPVVALASSAAVYGDAQRDSIDEEHPLLPKSPYGISKLAAEHYLRLYASLYGMCTLSARFFSVYGPGQRKLVVYDLLVRLLEGEDPLVIESDPEVARDFVFVRDAARALVDLVRSATARGEAYNVASGRLTTLHELTEALLDASGTNAETRFTGKVRAGDPFRWRGDPTRARRLGVRCDTPLDEGIGETAAWVRNDLSAEAGSEGSQVGLPPSR